MTDVKIIKDTGTGLYRATQIAGTEWGADREYAADDDMDAAHAVFERARALGVTYRLPGPPETGTVTGPADHWTSQPDWLE